MMHNCYQKTEKGREEIATRKYGLSLRIRSILLLVDGKRSCADLVQAYPGLGLTESLLLDLEQQGFIIPTAPVRKKAKREDKSASVKADSTQIHTQSDLIVAVEDAETADRDRSAVSRFLDTIFPSDLPVPLDESLDRDKMTVADDHLQLPRIRKPLQEHCTLFEAIKVCYLNGLDNLPPAATAPLLRAIRNAQTTRSLCELRDSYLDVVRAARGSAAAVRMEEELDLLLFACET